MTQGIQEARYLAVVLKAIRLSEALEYDCDNEELPEKSAGALMELDEAINTVFGTSPDTDFAAAKAEVIRRILAYKPRDIDAGTIVFDAPSLPQQHGGTQDEKNR